MENVLYQTVKDKNNIDYIKLYAPFECVREDAWLGPGYYFWDTFEELAHAWGKYGCSGRYVVCKCILSCNDNEILDLAGNTKQMREMQSVVRTLKTEFGVNITWPFVMNFIRSKTKFNYCAIRVNGLRSFNADERINEMKIKFDENRKAYIELLPAIQICVIDKSILQLPVQIVFPEQYCDEYIV